MDLANNYTEHDQSITTSQGEGIDLPHETKEQDPSNAIQDQETQHPDLDLAPDGGAKAWLVAAGGFSVCFCCLGFSNAFGTFEEYYLKHQLHGESASNIAWIGSTSAFLQFAAGMIGGPMFDRFGAKIIRPAALLYFISFILLSFCKTYWQIMLVQGILMGIVMGFIQFPAFAAVSQYFDKKRAAALGIVISGSSFGGIIVPILVSKLLNGSSLSFSSSVRIIAFITLPFLTFGSLVIKPRLSSRTSRFFLPRIFTDLKFDLLILSLFFIFIGMWTPLFFLPTYAVQRGISSTLAGYMLAIINAASTFGRIIPAIVADKYGRLNIFALGALVTGIIIFCMNSATTKAGTVIYSIFFGFASGTIISGASTSFSLCVRDARDIGTYMGMGFAISGVGALIGPPVNGAFVARYGGFVEVSIFSGAMCLAGAIIAIGTKCATTEGLLGRV